MLVGPQRRSGYFGEGKNGFPYRDSKLGPPSSSPSRHMNQAMYDVLTTRLLALWLQRDGERFWLYGVFKHRLYFDEVRFFFRSKIVQSNLGSRTPRIMNNSVYEQIFRTRSVSDDVLCLELRTRKPSTTWSDKLGVSASAVCVEEWSSGKNPKSATPSRVVLRDRKRKRIPFQTITFHFLTTFHLRRQLSSSPPST